LFLAALLDTYSRFIVGWAMNVYRDEVLVTGDGCLTDGISPARTA